MAIKNTQQSLPENFSFELFGAGTKQPFRGYISQIDPTVVGPGVLIGGSVNTLKSLTEAVQVRPGLMRRGIPDSDNAGVTSSYEWETSYDQLRVLRVVLDESTNLAKLQVESNLADGQTYLWYDLMTAQTSGRFVFDTYWVQTLLRDELIFVRGGPDFCSWSGGVGSLASATSDTIFLNQDVQFSGFLAAGGNLLINGNPYAYTGAAYVPNIIYDHSDTTIAVTLSPGNNLISQLFTTGADSNGITTVSTFVNLTSAFAGSWTITCAIYTDDAGVPGTLLGSSVFTSASIGAPGTTPVDFILNIESSPNTNYHVVFSSSLSNFSFIQFYTGNSSAVGTNESSDGTSWNAIDGYLYATVTENIGTDFELTGVSPDPSAEPVNSVVVAVPVVTPNTPNQDNSNDFIKTINNQVHVGSYLSQQIYISSESNFLNYTVPLPRRAGDPDLIVIDSLAKGITVQKGASDLSGNAVVAGGIGDWYTIVRVVDTNLFAQTGGVSVLKTEDVTVVRTQTADLSTALAHEFIDQIENNIVYLDQNNQLREFGIVRNVTNAVLPLLSLDVYTELKNRNFTGGALRVVAHEGDTTVYITAPNDGIDYMYQVRNSIDEVGNAVAERLWQPPQIRGLSRIAVIDGVEYGHSAVNPQLYQMWDTDQYYDDGTEEGDQLPYSCHAVTSYLSLGRTQQMNFDKLYFEGYMTRGSTVYASTYMEYQGAKGIQVSTINNPIDPGKKIAKFYGAVDCPVPGESILGNIEIGDGILPPATQSTPVPKFRAIRRVKSLDVFEAAIDVWSADIDSNWSLLLVGANLQPAKRQPTGIMGLSNLMA